MASVRNLPYWEQIEDMEPFSIPEEDDRHYSEHDRAWKHLEFLQQGGRLNARDMINLYQLLDSVYELGQSAQRVRGNEEDADFQKKLLKEFPDPTYDGETVRRRIEEAFRAR